MVGYHDYDASGLVPTRGIDELMAISAIAGDLSGKFLEYKNNDGMIDAKEADELEQIAIKARKELRAFENMIHKVKG